MLVLECCAVNSSLVHAHRDQRVVERAFALGNLLLLKLLVVGLELVLAAEPGKVCTDYLEMSRERRGY